MNDTNIELDQFPQVGNSNVIIMTPTKLFLDWFNYVSEDTQPITLNSLESISFLTYDFDTQLEFREWLQLNYHLLFEVRLNYECTDKFLWPEIRTFQVFESWFDITYSNIILDLEVVESIEMI